MTHSYCPKCGGYLDARYIQADERTRQICRDCGFVFYQNSRPCVGVLVVQDEQVLLVKRAIAPFKGFWDIPGGFLEAGEHPADGAIRELREETGLVIEPVEILDIYMDVYGPDGDHTLNVCYLARIAGGEPEAGTDAMEMRWFPLESLPSNVAFAWAQEALALLKRNLESIE